VKRKVARFLNKRCCDSAEVSGKSPASLLFAGDADIAGQSAMRAQSVEIGWGLGLRREHYETILNTQPNLGWLEILTENYLVDGGKPLHYLDRIRAHYPMAMHGVSLSIGGSDAIDVDYLQRVKNLAQRIEPLWISDHLCWTGVDGSNMHDLLPLPYTEEALEHVVERVQRVQDFLGRQILLENVSSYITYAASTISEWEFLHEVAERADCLLLLDINNVYVSSVNHEFDALTYLRHLPAERICQFHLAGHTDRGDYLIDTHDQPIIQPVWDLYAAAVGLFGSVATMIERDDNIPSLDVLLDEIAIAQKISAEVLGRKHIVGIEERCV
jgi:uncharacterized protein (UPF0276 family)